MTQEAWLLLAYGVLGPIALLAATFIYFYVMSGRALYFEAADQIEYAKSAPSDLMSKWQSGEWEIAMPPKNDGPNWSLRELFCYIEPSLAEHNDPLIARDIGQDVLDKLSTLQLSAWGRPDCGGQRRPLTYIPGNFWSGGAEFTYWFLDGEEGDDHRYLVHAKTSQPDGVLGIESGYRDIQVNRREAMQIWRKKPEANAEGGGC